ncbi:hypothetical protein DL89DRAFT_270187 [Linderina pennispora]|uniref:F-box domain-containing protein n=1 Tax=Linderina pennispora TaxID=61395 RepID=A0A1Y1VYA4_9FUNG|nr:uncharacterized protein DL89DRAFT_270187 [Linderina pennispora]ORX66248.1 hypothetical protein DL89DRAFT_270187 [Linderina pennispora]
MLLHDNPAITEKRDPLKRRSSDELPPRPAAVVHALSLTGVCQAWRDIALNILFEDAFFEDSPKTKVDVGYPQWIWPSKVLSSLAAALHLGIGAKVRSMSVDVDLRRLVNGASLREWPNNPVYGKVFNTVMTLNINLVAGVGIDHNALNSDDRSDQFCSIISNVFPNARAIRLLLVDRHWDILYGEFMETMYLKLLDGKGSVTLGPRDTLFRATDFDYIIPEIDTPLTKLTIRDIRSCSAACDLIRKHASTLEELDITCLCERYMFYIVQDMDDVDVIYPQLRKLSVKDGNGINSHIDNTIWTVNWFPALEDLSCSTESPEVHTMVIKLTSTTLKRAVLKMSSACCYSLLYGNTFDDCQYPEMEYFDATYTTTQDYSMETIDASLLMGSTATVLRSVGGDILAYSEVKEDLEATNPLLQVFETSSIAATFDEALEFVKSRPYLRQFGINIVFPEEQLDQYLEHAQCYGRCTVDSERETEHTEVLLPELNVRCFIDNHMDMICAQNDYLEEMFRRHHPVSERLIAFEATRYCMFAARESLVVASVVIVHLALLFPTVNQIYWGMKEYKRVIYRSDLRQHASFRAMEERLLALVSGGTLE